MFYIRAQKKAIITMKSALNVIFGETPELQRSVSQQTLANIEVASA